MKDFYFFYFYFYFIPKFEVLRNLESFDALSSIERKNKNSLKLETYHSLNSMLILTRPYLTSSHDLHTTSKTSILIHPMFYLICEYLGKNRQVINPYQSPMIFYLSNLLLMNQYLYIKKSEKVEMKEFIKLVWFLF